MDLKSHVTCPTQKEENDVATSTKIKIEVKGEPGQVIYQVSMLPENIKSTTSVEKKMNECNTAGNDQYSSTSKIPEDTSQIRGS